MTIRQKLGTSKGGGSISGRLGKMKVSTLFAPGFTFL